MLEGWKPISILNPSPLRGCGVGVATVLASPDVPEESTADKTSTGIGLVSTTSQGAFDQVL